MLQSYLTTFIRIVLRRKVYSAITIAGLAIGIASSLLIMLYITDELSYDRFHKDAGRIYRIGLDVRFGGVEGNYAMSGGSFAESMQKDISGIESYLRIVNRPVVPIMYNERIVNATNVILADSNFFSFFSFKLIAGDKRTALAGPDKIVLTESAAQNIFGVQTNGYRSIVGRTILLGEQKVATQITGIAANAPHNSHFHFDAILSMDTDANMKQVDFLGLTCYSYIKLKKNKNLDEITISIPAFFDKHAGPEIVSAGNTTLDALRMKGDDFGCLMMPLTSIHLDSHLLIELESNGNRSHLYILVLIASFTFLLASVNFVNLSTLQTVNRAKEFGLRKVMGALPERLISQLILESFIYTVISLFLGLALIAIFLSPFNFLASKHLSIDQLFTREFAAYAFLLAIAMSILTGICPSFYISSFGPIEVLKGKLGIGSRGGGFRNTMVTFQFIVSATLIMGSIIVFQQLQYLQNKSPGYAMENVICLTNAIDMKNAAEAFKNEVKSITFFVDASFCSRIPSEIIKASGYKRIGSDQWNTIHSYSADEDYFNTLKLTLASGRFFSRDFPSDSLAVVINETGAQLLKIDNLDRKEYLAAAGGATYEIVGIIRDFNFESLESAIKPLVLYKGGSSRMLIRLTPGRVDQKISLLGKIWKKYTDSPFEYSILANRLDAQYKWEERLGRIAIVITSLSIIIACLGLFGLVTYMARQRTKEIGIRKLLGASPWQIAVLFSKSLVRIILVAFAIAIPVTWYGMNIWLDEFAYHIHFNRVVVEVTGCIIMAIVLATVSYQIIKVAVVNPVDSLKVE